MARRGQNVPFWDDWNLLPLLERAIAGTLRLGDLWTQQNEHRQVLPQLLRLGLARLSQWDLRCVWLHVRWPASRVAVRPWAVLASYAILSATMTGIGRIGWGVEQALAARYATIGTLFWISVFVIAALAITRALSDRPRAHRRAACAALLVVGVPLVGASYVTTWRFGARVADIYSDVLRRGGECLRFHRIAPDPCLNVLLPNVRRLREQVGPLEALRLGPFARQEDEPPFSTYAVLESRRPAGWIDRIGIGHDEAEFVVSGWAMDPTTSGAVGAVLVVADGKVVGRARTGDMRTDVAKRLGSDRLLRSGWSFRFGAFRLGEGSHALEAYALLDERRVARLAGGRTVEVRRRT